MLPGPCPYIDVSVDDVMLACLAHTHIYLLLYVTPHLLFALLTTSRLYFSLLFATYVSICNVVDYMG